MARPGKFEASGALGELFYEISLDGVGDEETGEADTTGFFVLFRGPFELDELSENWPDAVRGLSQSELKDLSSAAGAIMVIDGNGFVTVAVYDVAGALQRDWDTVEEDVAESLGDDEFEPNASRPRKGWSGHGMQSPYTRTFKPPKYNREMRLTQLDESNMRRYGVGQFPSFGKSDHLAAADRFRAEADDLQNRLYATISAGEARYGDHGPVISGGFHDDWPNHVKEQIRRLNREMNAAKEAAQFHEVLATSRGMSPNASRGSVDENAARELELYIDNDRRFSMDSPEGMGRAVRENQLKKLKKGMWDADLSVKGWRNMVDEAARSYAKEFANASDWHRIFNVPTRDLVARGMAEKFRESVEGGEYTENKNLRGVKIKEALAYVHHWERERGRVVSAKEAVRYVGLSAQEARVLTDALNIKPSELGYRSNQSRDAGAPTSRREAEEAIRAAESHVHEGKMQSSARLALDDARNLFAKRDYHYARLRAAESMKYSVGILNVDYLRAVREIRYRPNASNEEYPIANPDAYGEDHLWLFSFGAYSSTHVYVWADSLDSGFEEAVEWLDENAPGHLIELTEDDLKRSAEDLDLKWRSSWPDWEDPEFQKIVEHAESDLTLIGHTSLKHGQYVASYEWTADEVTDPNEYNAVKARSVSAEDLDLDAFFDAYVEAALWSSTDDSRDDGGDPLDENYGPEDLSEEAEEKMRKDADSFATENASLIIGKESEAGHDFWLTRNEHGAGFWDGDWEEPAASILTDASKVYGSQDIYVGDDGQLYVS